MAGEGHCGGRKERTCQLGRCDDPHPLPLHYVARSFLFPSAFACVAGTSADFKRIWAVARRGEGKGAGGAPVGTSQAPSGGALAVRDGESIVCLNYYVRRVDAVVRRWSTGGGSGEETSGVCAVGWGRMRGASPVDQARSTRFLILH